MLLDAQPIGQDWSSCTNTSRVQMGVYHVLACGIMAGTHCITGNCLQQTVLTTPLMCQVAKVDIQEASAELQ